MKCQVCGNSSGKYPLCRACNLKKERGEIIKCSHCNKWHASDAPCYISAPTTSPFLYDPKAYLISKSEQAYYAALCSAVPQGFHIFPQVNLAAFIVRTDNARFQNELFRNVDFLITSAKYQPLMVVEINDQTHYSTERKERDEKVRNICEEAGIPILTLWTQYGINPEYIKKRIEETLASLPISRVPHFIQTPEPIAPPTPSSRTVETPSYAQDPCHPNNKNTNSYNGQSPSYTNYPPQNPYYGQPFYYPNQPPRPKKSSGCYIATAVYGSYDCPQVWTLRRYRDNQLAKTWCGRRFIAIYYAISPTLVRWFGNTKWFQNIWKNILDKKVQLLQSKGFENTPYND